MKNQLIKMAALAAIVASTATLHAQTAAPVKATKIGVINMQAAIANTAEGKKIITDLQRKYAPRQAELQRLQQEIQAIQDQLAKQQATLSEEEQGRMTRDAEEKQTLLKRSAEDAQNDFNHDRDEAINRIGQKMVKVISAYATQSGLELVLDDAQIPIYYASKDIEITAEIVKRYDVVNPSPDASAAPKPASTPATSK